MAKKVEKQNKRREKEKATESKEVKFGQKQNPKYGE